MMKTLCLLVALTMADSMALAQQSVPELSDAAVGGDKAALGQLSALANKGDATAQLKLGNMYRNGEGVSKDAAQAVVWYRKAAEQGHSDAQYELSEMYTNGEGILKDEIRALNWCRKAVEQGNPRAQVKLGFIYAIGEGVEKSLVKAAGLFRDAADQGNADAQYTLGMMNMGGKGFLSPRQELLYGTSRLLNRGMQVRNFP